MPERIIYHNADHIEHRGWIDNEGKPWDVPERLFLVIDALLSDGTVRTEWLVVPEFHQETLDLIAKAHSVEMIEAIARASSEATHDRPVKTRFDKHAETDASAIYPGTFEQALMSAECAASAAEHELVGEAISYLELQLSEGRTAKLQAIRGDIAMRIASDAATLAKDSDE